MAIRHITDDTYHQSVLLKEIVSTLEEVRGGDKGWVLDGTLGDAGHTIEFLRKGFNVVGVDVDPQGLERARKRVEGEGFDKSRYIFLKGNFRDLENLILKQTETAEIKFVGCVLDLGVSSLQLEDPVRGFSFGKSGPIDMRMDPELGVKAIDLIKLLSKGELDEIFKTYGEEKYSRSLADALVRAREVDALKTTEDLAGVAEGVYRKFGDRDGRVHPATRMFQALRIVVNDELGAIRDALPQLLERTQKYGRICIISFHSLEDRIIKNTFREWESLGKGIILTDKPLTPTEEELSSNPRSRSAKLRIFEKKGENI